jgi:hypothetical protein
MEDVSLPTIPQYGAVEIVKGHHGPVLYHAFEAQLLCSQGEFFRPLPFSWVQLFTFGEPNDSVSAECLKEMLTRPDQRPICLVMDALDRSPKTSGIRSPRKMVLQPVMELVELHLPNLRICVTSRPEIDIRDVFEPLTSHRMSLHDRSG